MSTQYSDFFPLVDGALQAEGVPLQQIAETVGTPAYIYSRAAIESAWNSYAKPLADIPHLVCFAVKSNSNLGVLNVLAELGAGFDIVSVGELERVLAAGGNAGKVVFSGVGKQDHEMRRALEAGVFCFNIESIPELDRLQAIAADMGVTARISLRVNPNVDAQTHPYISTGLKDNKFGIDIERAEEIYQRADSLPNIEVTGVDCHIGSQLTSLDPFLDALDILLALVDKLAAQGIVLSHLDLGGGLGVTYKDEQPPETDEYIRAVHERIGSRNLTLVFEPGRSIVANAGVLLTRVELLKHTEHKNFAIIDGAMNDLIRPALYGSWHDILPVVPRSGEELAYDIVGPVCETSDFLGKGRDLCLKDGDLLAVMSAGAYGMVMASNFNTRGRAAEVLVSGQTADIVRRRETIADQLSLESLPGENPCF
ncbi:diaminopimelate decarboxylase [Parendozoicomonas haliclonae]|uniref:Diaminopimelate decarboxylase n=1 Tax=Parendozoicomonas haliclonae TaxID=1960125 RepID=A0A1X7ALM6_9GAMM|nr:diaminopimelate decarboxylase [Parendozoicomonas haliclonae]SMA48462.1 Diaminopimelate decarboxylase [Parendozoicomonas haliclonae]